MGDAPGGGLAWPPSRSPPRQFGQAQQPSEPGRRRAQRTPSLVHRWFAAAAEAPTAARRQEEPPSSRQRGAPGPPVSQCQELVLLSPSPPPSLKAWGHLSGVSNHRQREAAPRRVPARYQVPGTRARTAWEEHSPPRRGQLGEPAPTEDATPGTSAVGVRAVGACEAFWRWPGMKLAASKASPSQGIATQCMDRSKILNKK